VTVLEVRRRDRATTVAGAKSGTITIARRAAASRGRCVGAAAR